MRDVLKWLWASFLRVLKPEWAGRLEYDFGWRFLTLLTPMNGQEGRRAITKAIISACRISRIVETGTLRGTTTEWFAQFGIPVVTCEIDRRHAAFSARRLRPLPNVTIEQCNSVDLLGRLAKQDIDRFAPTLFYLDAHWYEYLPLRDELGLVLRNFRKAVVLVDDFAVPDDPGYHFDDYGPGKRLSLDYVQASNLPAHFTYFPSMPSQQETGMRRGCVVLTTDAEMAAILNRLPQLRAWNG